jgi:pectate lyase
MQSRRNLPLQGCRMRTTLPTIAALFILTLCVGAATTRAENGHSKISEVIGETPIGFGRNANGGCTERSCAVCMVTSLDDDHAHGTLRNCAENPEPRWIKFTARGTIHLRQPLTVASNKIIDGRKLKHDDGPVTITGSERFLFLIENRENIIVTDLYFKTQGAPGTNADRCNNPQVAQDTVRCGTAIALHGATKNVWVNHSDFDHCGAKCITVWTAPLHSDRPRGKVPGGDLITLSNNVFRNSFFAVLIGASGQLPRENIPDHMRVTLYGNVFYNIYRRAPRAASFVKVHMFNNLMKYWGHATARCVGHDYSWPVSATGEAELLLENNVFTPRLDSACKLSVQIQEKQQPGGYHRGDGRVRARGNLLRNGAQPIEENEADVVFNPDDQNRPEYSYPYKLRGVDEVARTIEQTAGVRGFAKAKLGD